MVPSQRTRATLERRVVAAFTTGLPRKLAALFFAVVLWAVVSVEEPNEEIVQVELVPVITDSGIVVRRPLPRVQALVVGRGRDLIRLAASPPVIRTLISSDTPETLTVALSSDIVDLPANVKARVREVLPRSVTLHLDLLAERMVPVKNASTFRPDEGIILMGPPRFSPESVTISGPRSLVEQIDSVLTRHMTVGVGDSLPHLIGLDTSRLGVTVNPSRVSVSLPVAFKGDTVRLPPETTSGASPPRPPRQAPSLPESSGRPRAAPGSRH
jgi:hypothetical protein